MAREEKVNAMEEAIINHFGKEAALDEILLALDSDIKEDIYPWICSQNDIDIEED